MKNFYLSLIMVSLLSCATSKQNKSQTWIPLFDGKSLKDWKVGENAERGETEKRKRTSLAQQKSEQGVLVIKYFQALTQSFLPQTHNSFKK
jgi:hypothetical protein